MISASIQQAASDQLRARVVRDAVFGSLSDGFGEPAWDMLLCLTSIGGGPMSEDALLAIARTPIEIARPFIGWLASRDLVTIDGGGIRLAPHGAQLMSAAVVGGQDA